MFVDANVAYLNLNETTDIYARFVLYCRSFRYSFHYRIYSMFSSKIYNLYDIYNNARNLGGKLNIGFDQNFIIDADGSNFLKKSNEMKKIKYQYRENMNDITLRIGVNVTIGTFSISYISSV